MKIFLLSCLFAYSVRAEIHLSVKRTDAGLVYILVTANESYKILWSYGLRDWWPIYYHPMLPGERASSLSALAWAPGQSELTHGYYRAVPLHETIGLK